MKALFKYILYSTFFAMSLPLVTACDDDEATDPYDINYVYIYKPSETNATLEYKGDGTFLKEIATEHILSPVRCTKPAPQDLTIQLAIDRSLVDAYNSEYGTSYIYYPFHIVYISLFLCLLTTSIFLTSLPKRGFRDIPFFPLYII